MKPKNKTYLMIYLAHEDDGYQIKRVTGEQIRQEVKKGNQEFTLIDGIILKSEHNKIDVTNL
jgi:hypothetical protein